MSNNEHDLYNGVTSQAHIQEADDIITAVHSALSLPEFEAIAHIFHTIVACESVSDHEGVLADAIEQLCRSCRQYEVTRIGDSVVASTKAHRKHRIILAAHLDTVPVDGNLPPVWVDESDSRYRKDASKAQHPQAMLWGRGASDMKGSLSAFLFLALTVTETDYDITFIFYDHEETGAARNGLKRIVEQHPDLVQGDFAIVGEATGQSIAAGCNGSLRFDVISQGKAAHSAHSWMGKNAIHQARHILEVLDEYKARCINVESVPYQEGLNATLIHGGTVPNMIPDTCTVHVNYRYAPDKSSQEAAAYIGGPAAAEASLNTQFTADGGLFEGWSLIIRNNSPAAKPTLYPEVVRRFTKYAKQELSSSITAKLGWTDVARFIQLDIPAVNFGTGNPAYAHNPNEQASVDDLVEYAQFLKRYLQSSSAVNCDNK